MRCHAVAATDPQRAEYQPCNSVELVGSITTTSGNKWKEATYRKESKTSLRTLVTTRAGNGL